MIVNVFLGRRRTADSEFKELDHPRNDSGQFADSPSPGKPTSHGRTTNAGGHRLTHKGEAARHGTLLKGYQAGIRRGAERSAEAALRPAAGNSPRLHPGWHTAVARAAIFEHQARAPSLSESEAWSRYHSAKHEAGKRYVDE